MEVTSDIFRFEVRPKNRPDERGGKANDDDLRGIMALGNGYGVDIVVEGVEPRDMAVRLGGLGFGLFQGFYFSPPLELEEAIAYAREHGR